jgi:hypothetical protein
MKKAREILQENIHNLIKDQDTFFKNVKPLNKRNTFTGPSVYFHQQAIECVRSTDDYEKLLDNIVFLEYIYATLTAWGMHRMGPTGAKMVDFEVFKKSVHENKETIIQLSKYKLHELDEKELDGIMNQLHHLFDGIKIMKSSIKLVGNSKVMHHLLPDLIPPIDRQYTLKFFYGGYHIPKNQEQEEALFFDTLKEFWKICQVLELKDNDFKGKGSFTTSIPKMIDNAIIGYLKGKKGVEQSQINKK